MDIDPKCPVCRIQARGYEFKCKRVAMIWALCDMEQERLRLMEARTALEVVEELMKMCAKKRALAATLMWCWWCERNSIREGHKVCTCEELAWTITHQAEAFYDLNVQPKESLRQARLGESEYRRVFLLSDCCRWLGCYPARS
jgi:hypothetical protein